MHESIQPIVLVGGASRRFGRDKLREPVGTGLLVDRAIAALREVFGPRVVAVGNCDPVVAARADRHLPDRYPGTGPIGGIIAALEEFGADVFVLPGDLPAITPEVVRALSAVAAENPYAWAVRACIDRPEPCLGVYRQAGLGALRARLAAAASLAGAFGVERVVLVPVRREEVANANTPDVLRDIAPAQRPGDRSGAR